MDNKIKNFKIETAYNNISVLYRNGELEFRSPDDALQSVIDLKNPHRLALPNLEFLIAVLLFVPAPERILMLGTAAGSMLHFLQHHYPDAHIDSLDIDHELIEKLLQLNILPQAGPQLQYIYDDASHYIEHCQQKYDLILVDIFRGAQSPEWLSQNSTLSSLHRMLENQSALAFNLLIDSDHAFNHFYRNLRLACNNQTLCMPVEGYENTVAYGFRGDFPQRELSWYMERTLELSQSHGIDYMAILSTIYTTNPNGEGIL